MVSNPTKKNAQQKTAAPAVEEGWEEETGNFAPIWKPTEEGQPQELIGKVVKKITTQFSKNGEPDSIHVETAGGEVIQTPAHAWLVNRLSGIEVGDVVKIIHVGQDEESGAAKYVVHKKKQPAKV